MRISSVLLLATSILAGCTETTTKPPDVVGPFGGPVQRFAVDKISFPTTANGVKQIADDLDGDGIADNQAGSVISTLASQGDTTPHADDMIAAGTIASVFEIEADD